MSVTTRPKSRPQRAPLSRQGTTMPVLQAMPLVYADSGRSAAEPARHRGRVQACNARDPLPPPDQCAAASAFAIEEGEAEEE